MNLIASKFLLRLAIIVIVSFSTVTQAQYRHEFSGYIGGGLSTLQYNIDNGVRKDGFGGHLGIGYTYFFSTNIGISTGVEVAMYNTKFKSDIFRLSYDAVDNEGSPFEFRSEISDFVEKQRAMMLQIPLMLQFQTSGDRMWYVAIGGKFGLPMNGAYKTTATFRNSGYYEFENYEYTTQQFMGFGIYPDNKASGNFEFKPAIFASAELGRKRILNNNGLILYIGLYLDYGLNNVSNVNAQNSADMPPLVTNDLQINSVLNSQSYPSTITPLAAGIKLKLSYGAVKIDLRSQPKKRGPIQKGYECDRCRICICLGKQKPPHQIKKGDKKSQTKQKSPSSSNKSRSKGTQQKKRR
ncbi:MAG: PorT family protein [Marinilabiliaceae bacterium]|nr:PorT family protein [Marinilabiliaceae bacterium]